MWQLGSSRDVYGKTLVELGRQYKEVVVLDADTASSTRTCSFKEEFPDRFFNFGVAEANMIGAAAGIALCNKKPYVSSFGIFGTARVFEQIRTVLCWPNLDVKIILTHNGITVGEDGVSHQSIEDIGLLRLLPNMKIIVPTDRIETRKVILASINIPGPLYIRLSRQATPIIHNEDYEFEFGKGKILKEGKDIAIIATGIMVKEALEVAYEVKDYDIAVVQMSTIKPIDKELLIDLAEKIGRIITLEEHLVIGGLGSAVAETITETGIPCKIKKIGIEDEFGLSGLPEELLKKFGLNKADIIEKIKKFF